MPKKSCLKIEPRDFGRLAVQPVPNGCRSPLMGSPDPEWAGARDGPGFLSHGRFYGRRSGPTQMRAVRLSTAVGPHVGRFKGVWQASESGFWVKKPVKTPEERLRNARETAETLHTPFKHDRAHHMGAIDHRGQYHHQRSAISASTWPRWSGCPGGLFWPSQRPPRTKIERNTNPDPKISFEPPRAPEPGSSPPAPPMGVGATARPVSAPTDGRKYYNTGGL